MLNDKNVAGATNLQSFDNMMLNCLFADFDWSKSARERDGKVLRAKRSTEEIAELRNAFKLNRKESKCFTAEEIDRIAQCMIASGFTAQNLLTVVK